MGRFTSIKASSSEPDVAPSKEACRALNAIREVKESRKALQSQLSAVCLTMYAIETDYIPRSLDVIYATRKVPVCHHTTGAKRSRDDESGGGGEEGQAMLEDPLLLRRDKDSGDVAAIVGNCRGRAPFRNFLRQPFDKHVDLGENVVIVNKVEVKKGAGTASAGTAANTNNNSSSQPPASSPPLTQTPLSSQQLLHPSCSPGEGKAVFSSASAMISSEDSRIYRRELLADHKRYLSLSYPSSFGLAEKLRMERLKASRHRDVVASLNTASPSRPSR